MPETSPEKRWGRAKVQCANCPLVCPSSPKPECAHPHRVEIQDRVKSGQTLGFVLMCRYWNEGKFLPQPGEQRAAVELFTDRPKADPKYNVVEII